MSNSVTLTVKGSKARRWIKESIQQEVRYTVNLREKTGILQNMNDLGAENLSVLREWDSGRQAEP